MSESFLFQAELKRGAEIIVCTPGRMIDMLAANGGMTFDFLFDDNIHLISSR